jgi:hypothetical protein
MQQVLYSLVLTAKYIDTPVYQTTPAHSGWMHKKKTSITAVHKSITSVSLQASHEDPEEGMAADCTLESKSTIPHLLKKNILLGSAQVLQCIPQDSLESQQQLSHVQQDKGWHLI